MSSQCTLIETFCLLESCLQECFSYCRKKYGYKIITQRQPKSQNTPQPSNFSCLYDSLFFSMAQARQVISSKISGFCTNTWSSNTNQATKKKRNNLRLQTPGKQKRNYWCSSYSGKTCNQNQLGDKLQLMRSIFNLRLLKDGERFSLFQATFLNFLASWVC